MRRLDKALAEDAAAGRLSERFGAVLAPSADSDAVRALEELASFERACGSDDPDRVRLRLEVEYNRLFVGPTALLAPPYESYYASEARAGGGRLRTDEERAVLRAYERRGFTVPADRPEFPDHIAVELEYLSLLSGSESRAWASGEVGLAFELQQAQASFIGDHLGVWVGRLAGRARDGARMPLYPAVLDLVALFCA